MVAHINPRPFAVARPGASEQRSSIVGVVGREAKETSEIEPTNGSKISPREPRGCLRFGNVSVVAGGSVDVFVPSLLR